MCFFLQRLSLNPWYTLFVFISFSNLQELFWEPILRQLWGRLRFDWWRHQNFQVRDRTNSSNHFHSEQENFWFEQVSSRVQENSPHQKWKRKKWDDFFTFSSKIEFSLYWSANEFYCYPMNDECCKNCMITLSYFCRKSYIFYHKKRYGSILVMLFLAHTEPAKGP